MGEPVEEALPSLTEAAALLKGQSAA
jgi:hypothetical protein